MCMQTAGEGTAAQLARRTHACDPQPSLQAPPHNHPLYQGLVVPLGV